MSKRIATKGDWIQVSLKMRESMRARLEREAKQNQNTLMGEMRLRLERSLHVGAIKSVEKACNDLAARIRRQAAAVSEMPGRSSDEKYNAQSVYRQT